MSLLSDLQALVESCGVSVETGVFSGKAPDTYLVITPLSDSMTSGSIIRERTMAIRCFCPPESWLG